MKVTCKLRYLNRFTKATPLSSSVSLSLGKDAPLRVKYELESEESGALTFYLAPLEDDD